MLVNVPYRVEPTTPLFTNQPSTVGGLNPEVLMYMTHPWSLQLVRPLTHQCQKCSAIGTYDHQVFNVQTKETLHICEHCFDAEICNRAIEGCESCG